MKQILKKRALMQHKTVRYPFNKISEMDNELLIVVAAIRTHYEHVGVFDKLTPLPIQRRILLACKEEGQPKPLDMSKLFTEDVDKHRAYLIEAIDKIINIDYYDNELK